MDELPLVSEIREARLRYEAVAGATNHLQLLQAAALSLDVLDREFRRTNRLTEGKLPGHDELLATAETFPQLADLATPGRAGQPSARLTEQRARLDAVVAALRPLSADERRYAGQLHDLKHDQNHLLKDPRYADAVAEVTRLSALRDAVLEQINPLQGRLTAVAPSRTVIQSFRSQLAWVEAPPEDPRGIAAWRAATIAIALLDVLADTLSHTGFELVVPEPTAMPESPSADDAERLLAWTQRQRDEVLGLGQALTAQATALQSEVDALHEQLRQHNQTLQDLLG